MICSNTTHKLYMFAVIFHYTFWSYILTVIRWNTGTEGKVLPEEASCVSLFLLYLYST